MLTKRPMKRTQQPLDRSHGAGEGSAANRRQAGMYLVERDMQAAGYTCGFAEAWVGPGISSSQSFPPTMILVVKESGFLVVHQSQPSVG